MGKAIPTVEGWHSQHMVFAMDFSAWNCFTAEEKADGFLVHPLNTWRK